MSSVVDSIQTGHRPLHTRAWRERIVRAVDPLGRVVKIWFNDSRTGRMELILLATR
jgi:hypothetical protein